MRRNSNYSIVLILLFEILACLIAGMIVSVFLLTVSNNLLGVGVHTAIMFSVFFGIPTGSILGVFIKRLIFKEDINCIYLLIIYLSSFSYCFLIFFIDSKIYKDLITHTNEKTIIISILAFEYIVPVIYDFYCMIKSRRQVL